MLLDHVPWLLADLYIFGNVSALAAAAAAAAAAAKSLQSCPTLNDPMDCSLPGSSAHGIFQARVLEWGAIAFSVVPWRAWQFDK